MDNSLLSRTNVLASFGANLAETDELLAYNQNHFDISTVDSLCFPLSDELSVEVWQEYSETARCEGFPALGRYLPQLRFPVLDNISQTYEYRAATKRGADTRAMQAATGLLLADPDSCKVVLHPTSAGRIPLIIAGERQDFVALVRALTKRNEPVQIPDSMGACMVAGYANWDRIRRLREQYENSGGSAWPEAFQKLLCQKQLYLDQFILLSSGPYSGVSAAEMGMAEHEWSNLSLIIRREHECAHYFTRRVFRSMRTNLLDELIADYFGITAAAGKFHAEWLLKFLGLESFPRYRDRGRLENYRGTLSDQAFLVLQQLVERAASNLEDFDCTQVFGARGPNVTTALYVTLASFTLEELAGVRGPALLQEVFARTSATLLSAPSVHAEGKPLVGISCPSLVHPERVS